LPDLAGVAVVADRALEQAEHRFVQGYVDAAAAPGADHVALVDRTQDAVYRIERRDLVAERDADPDRRQVGDLGRVCRKMAQLAHRLPDRAECRLVAVRPRRAVARNPSEDAARVLLLNDLEAESPLLELARPVVFDHDVRPAEQAACQRLPLGMLEVEGDALLVARLQRPGQRVLTRADAPTAKGIAPAGVLGLDHVGAQIAKQPGTEGPGDEVPELQHLEAAKRAEGWPLSGPWGSSIAVLRCAAR
jgi:hypothetical protein